MKILFANKYFFRNGGSEVVMFDEMETLRSLGAEVIAFSMRNPANLPSDQASYFVTEKSYRAASTIDRLRAAVSFVHSPEAVAKIDDLIRIEKPDVLHCHNVYHQLTPSIVRRARHLGVPVVLTLHDYKTVCPVYTRLRNGVPCTECSTAGFERVLVNRCSGGSLGRSALLWAEARYHAAMRSYEQVDRFVAPSRFMRDAVIGRLGADKVVRIPNGIDASRIAPCDSDDGYVLFVGRVSSEKGVETLLRAQAAAGDSWTLKIAGTGPLLDELKARYPRAHFVGHLTGEKLGAVTRGAAIVVVPSQWHENCPLSILEAMANGKPVVASRIGGIPELVRHGVTGLLFEPGNIAELAAHVRTLLDDTGLRRRLGARARTLVETEHSSRAHAAALWSLYHDVITARKAR